jgi:hypothetical protein
MMFLLALERSCLLSNSLYPRYSQFLAKTEFLESFALGFRSHIHNQTKLLDRAELRLRIFHKFHSLFAGINLQRVVRMAHSKKPKKQRSARELKVGANKLDFHAPPEGTQNREAGNCSSKILCTSRLGNLSVQVGVPPGVGSGYDRFEVLGVGVRVFKDNVLLGGVVIYGLSILGTSLSTPPLALISVAGLLVGAGIAGTSFGIVLPAIAATVLE